MIPTFTISFFSTLLPHACVVKCEICVVLHHLISTWQARRRIKRPLLSSKLPLGIWKQGWRTLAWDVGGMCIDTVGNDARFVRL